MTPTRFRLAATILAGLALTATPSLAQKKKEAHKPAVCKRDACATTWTLRLAGLHCEGCAINVSQHLMAVKGVAKADVDHKAQRAIVRVCSRQPAAQKAWKAAVAKAGYQVVAIEKGEQRNATTASASPLDEASR